MLTCSWHQIRRRSSTTRSRSSRRSSSRGSPQIDAKQAEIDVAANECQKLQQKAEAVANSRKEAQEDLAKLEAEYKTKVFPVGLVLNHIV